MKPKAKRPATEEEVAKAKKDQIAWMRQNGCDDPEGTVERNLAEALSEGYKNETCSCGLTYLAFHHFVTCRQADCPFSDGVSLLERLEQSCESSDGSGTKA